MEKKIILIDDHALMRKGLKGLIEKLGPYNIIAEYENGLELTQAYPFEITPDLLVLDLSMPIMDGTQVVKWMKENNVKIPILLLTLMDSEDLILDLFRMGIRGYLNKNCGFEELRDALHQIFSTGFYHNEMMAKAMTFDNSGTQKKVKDMLTDKQLEFLKLVCHEDEYTYDQISDKMKVKKNSIDHYRTYFFETFGIKSKTGLVLFAMKNELLD